MKCDKVLTDVTRRYKENRVCLTRVITIFYPVVVYFSALKLLQIRQLKEVWELFKTIKDFLRFAE